MTKYEIGYHNFLKTEERTLNGFNHYHVFEYQQFKDGTFGYDEVKKGSIRKAHSFFGLMYFRWPNGSIETFQQIHYNMNMKYQVGDPVIYREDSSFSEPFNFDIEPLYIVIRFIKDSPYPKERLLLKKGFIYVISNIKEDCGSGHLGGITYVKESQLKLYTENNPDVLSFYCDAKEELKKLI